MDSEKKRERESEEDVNARTAKMLLASESVDTLSWNYLHMTSDQRARLTWWMSLTSLPKPLQEIIASTNVGVLMTLARLNRLFADLARQDFVWEYSFKRDFPREWKFCKGTLPFFVLEPSHPFYTPGIVKPEDASPWKRFYLNTARYYIILAKNFQYQYQNVLRNNDISSINVKLDKAQTIYRWVQKIILETHFNEHDYRVQFCWAWVVFFVAFLYPRKTWNSKEEIALDYLIFAAKSDSRNILLTKYLSHSHPYYILSPLLNNVNRLDEQTESPEIGPAPNKLWKKIKDSDQETNRLITFEDEDGLNSYYELLIDFWETHGNGWTDTDVANNLFSITDRKSLETQLNVLRLNGDFREQLRLSDDVYDQRVSALLRLWDTLNLCVKNPSVLGMTLPIPTLIMINESDNMKKGCNALARRLSGAEELVTSFESNTEVPFFSNVVLEQEFVRLCLPLNVFMNIFDIEGASNKLPHSLLRTYFQVFSRVERTKEYAPGKNKIKYLQSCTQCGTIPDIPQQCGGICHQTIYCGVKCQRTHWFLGHYKECQIKK